MSLISTHTSLSEVLEHYSKFIRNNTTNTTQILQHGGVLVMSGDVLELWRLGVAANDGNLLETHRKILAISNDGVSVVDCDATSGGDTVAYVRFASVYKNFQAADDFDKFVSELRPPASGEE